MVFGNQAIIEAGIDQMDGPERLRLAAELVASVVVNENSIGNPSASEQDIRDNFEDELERYIHFDGTINMALLRAF